MAARHDHGYKRLFSHPEMVADLLRGFVHEDWIRELDFSTLERFPGTRLREERSDDGAALADVPLAAEADLRRVAADLKAAAGVIDHGLFLDLSPEIFVGGSQGVRRL